MIDLHMHTTCSDGVDTPNEILQKAEAIKLEIVSITDHNNCLSYEKYDSYIFTGKIITGCEMATSFEKTVVEILGYGVDINVINQWYNSFYSAENLIKNEETLFQEIKSILNREQIKYSENLRLPKMEKGISKKTIYYDIITHKSNKNKIPTQLLESYGSFFREGLSNPNSPLFCNEAALYPTFSETIDLIKQAGGLTFLAHLFIYKVSDSMSFLERLLANQVLDGIECYHSAFNNEQSRVLSKYAVANNYFMSGGSDYHGKPNRPVKLGVGADNLDIPLTLIDDWVEKV